MKRILNLSIITLLSVAPSMWAEGLLMSKSYGWEQESQAKPVEYRSASKFGTVFNVVARNGEKQRIQTSLIVEDIVFSEVDCPKTITTQEEANRVANNVARLRKTISKWPGSQKYLQRYLTANQGALEQLKRGYVLSEGRWVTSQTYKAAVAAERRQLEERQAQADAALARDMQAKEEARAKRFEQERAAAVAKAAKLKDTLDTLEFEAVQLASAIREPKGLQKRAFALQRKLPKADFEDLYELGQYVFQTISRGGEMCVLVSHSISTLEDRFIDFWVRPLGDVDVTMVSGVRERVSVFVEARENDAAVKLELLRGQMEETNSEYQTLRTKFQIP